MPEAPTTTTSTPATTEPNPAAVIEPPWGKDFDPARAWQTIQHLRGVEKTLGDELKTAQATVKEAADADLSEAEKLRGTVTELTAKVTAAEAATAARTVADAVTEAGRKAGAVYPDALHKLVDVSALKIDGDKVTGVDEQIAAIKKAYPALFGKVAGADGGARGAAPAGSMNDLIRRKAGR